MDFSQTPGLGIVVVVSGVTEDQDRGLLVERREVILRENVERIAEVGSGVDVDDSATLERPLDRLADLSFFEKMGHLTEFRDEDERSDLGESLLKRITELQHEARDICDR